MGFDIDPPLVAGTVLIRSDIRSQDYVAGSSGWIIEADGDAEFNDVTIRGTLEVVDAPTHASIIIQNVGNNPQIDFTPGDWNPAANPANSAKESGYILAFPNTAPSASPMATMFVDSPTFTGKSAAELQFDSEPYDGSRLPRLSIQNSKAADIDVFVKGTLSVSGQATLSGNATVGGTLGVTGTSNLAAVNASGTVAASGNVTVGGTLTNTTDSMTYRRGLAYPISVSNASAASFLQAFVFPTAFPAGVTPMVMLNLNDTAGSTLKAIVSATGVSNNGFTLRARSGDGTAMGAWVNVSMQVIALV